MTTKFLIFCETKTESGSMVRYVDEILRNSDELQECLVHMNSIGVNVFKVLPLFVDEEQATGYLQC